MRENTLLNRHGLRYLYIGLILLVVANVIDLIFGKPFWGITRFIYMGFDDNVAAWYSSVLLAIAGLIAYECWLYAKLKNIQGGSSFLLFTGLLFFMSADEVCKIHEIVGSYFAQYLGISTKSFAQHSSWVWVGGPFAIAIFVAIIIILKKIFSLVSGGMFHLVLGFSLIVLGGIVLESTINFLNEDELLWLWNIEVILEESLEMAGTIFITYALVVWRDGMLELQQQTA